MENDDWHAFTKLEGFPAEGKLALKVNNWHVLVVSDDDRLFAFNDCCTHQASRLSTGRVRRGTLMCPLHGARFKVETGECLGGAYPGLRQFPLRVENGMIMVQLPGRPPGAGESPLE